MPNDPHTSERAPVDDAFTARLLEAFARHRAAERAEEQYAARQTIAAPSLTQSPQDQPLVRPTSPYLQIRRDLRAIREGRYHTTQLALAAPATIPIPPIVRASLGNRRSTMPQWWPQALRPFHQLSVQMAATLFLGLFGAGVSVFAYDVYAAEVRARPATVTYVNTPLADVITELRRRSGLNIRLCNVPPSADRVTLTLADTPIDSVLHRIARENALLVNWGWNPHTVLLQPLVGIEGGVGHNLLLYLLSYTQIGCRP